MNRPMSPKEYLILGSITIIIVTLIAIALGVNIVKNKDKNAGDFPVKQRDAKGSFVGTVVNSFPINHSLTLFIIERDNDKERMVAVAATSQNIKIKDRVKCDSYDILNSTGFGRGYNSLRVAVKIN